MNNGSFLNQLARLILSEQENNLHKVMVVLPTKRAGLFLKRALAEESEKSLLSPKVITLDELIELLSESKSISNRQLLFEFYLVYSKLEKEKADSFDKFLKWAPQLLSRLQRHK
jgi:ATP-dependent helicase/nuclease subunit B